MDIFTDMAQIYHYFYTRYKLLLLYPFDYIIADNNIRAENNSLIHPYRDYLVSVKIRINEYYTR